MATDLKANAIVAAIFRAAALVAAASIESKHPDHHAHPADVCRNADRFLKYLTKTDAS